MPESIPPDQPEALPDRVIDFRAPDKDSDIEEKEQSMRRHPSNVDLTTPSLDKKARKSLQETPRHKQKHVLLKVVIVEPESGKSGGQSPPPLA